MTTFPTLKPYARTWTPGQFPNSFSRSPGAQQRTVMLSNVQLHTELRLLFQGLTETEMLSIATHYVAQSGGFKAFDLPADVWSGVSSSSGYNPTGIWRYMEPPQVEDYGADDQTRYDVTVRLEGVVSEGINLAGGAFTALASLSGGAVSGGTVIGTGGDPYFYYVSLLLHMDGSNGSTTFTDSSSSALTVTANGGAQISTSQYKWNGASGTFNGSSAYLELADTSNQLLLSGDFTIECWVYFNSLSGTSVILQSTWIGIGGALALWVHSSYPNKLSLWADSYSSGAPIITGITSLATGTWYHVAATRSGNDWSLFVNGILQGTTTSSASVTGKIRRVGAYVDNTGFTFEYLNGYIDDLRITKGICRYNSAFTPPTGPFPNT